MDASSYSPAVGFIACFTSALFFGSNFVPVKKYETGDGFFFQWMLCISIYMVGSIVNAVRGFPTFYPLAMLGGALWSLGSLCVVPVIKTIGLSLGLLIWGTCNLIVGWATGRFGMFGIKKEIPDNLALNYTGVTFALVGAILFIFIKSEGGGPMRVATRLDSATEPLIVNPVGDLPHDLARDRPLATTCVEPADPDETSIDRLQPSTKRVVGVSLSVISGLFYGVTFVPVIYIQDNYKDSSQNGLDYVFAHMNGVLLTSCVTFIAYCAVMRNRPRVYPRAILPGLVSGAMLACGVTGWFIANQVLTETISFPIITTGPGVIAALWGVFVFREIQGKRNYLILLLAMCFILTGALLCAFSL